MSVAGEVWKRIKHMPKGKPFVGLALATVGPRTSVYKALSRMVLRGLLERVARGVYMLQN